MAFEKQPIVTAQRVGSITVTLLDPDPTLPPGTGQVQQASAAYIRSDGAAASFHMGASDAQVMVDEAMDIVFSHQSRANVETPSGAGAVQRVIVKASTGRMGVGTTTPGGMAEIAQTSTTAAIPTLRLKQSDLSEEFIRLDTTVGAGNPVDTAAIGTYYGKFRVYVEGVGAKFVALYNT